MTVDQNLVMLHFANYLTFVLLCVTLLCVVVVDIVQSYSYKNLLEKAEQTKILFTWSHHVFSKLFWKYP